MRKWLLVILIISVCGVSCKKEGNFRSDYSGGALGTSYNIVVISDEKINVQNEIDSVFTVINRSLSTYIPNSDISKINNGDTTLVVDHMFQEVFKLAKDIHLNTRGFFDPTVGTLVNAWGFGPERQITMDSAKVDSLLQYVGFDKVSLTAENHVKKTAPNIYIDFNAIAKGYSIDRLATMLDAKGVQNYLIEVGGELVAKGKNTLKGKSWVVGIDDPEMMVDRKAKILINLNDRALASSGNYRKFRIDDTTGKKYVHTVNPKTGFTQISNTLAVTILADNCATADAYATAFMAMELDEAFKLIAENETLEAYIIYSDEFGETQEFLTTGFKDVVVH
ncbi:FAD:protein FMN transferase [Maribacter sp. MAR_2009_72]|uniref:FAD:protein FMN transferase n=1 Tax=Maribacter sp. MAR_2009_72 TaxID=1250050 RepID=UPI00119B3BD6|nr:FAD:protein FMN transferase [Maribacter sp. MAR_2009_72]TVZ15226.1 thiamine biosynthesis lipoprotein [Maribacter sp. MAR_2009_72]